jgi:hypothetical protein
VAHSTNTGTFPDGTPATGQKVTFPGAGFDQYEGPKIRRLYKPITTILSVARLFIYQPTN